jgi:hypothetical protein
MKLENGCLLLPIDPILEGLTLDERRSLADSLACMDDVIKDVADQITEGWTDAASHGAISWNAYADPSTGLDYAKRKVARLAGKVALEEIAKLEKTVLNLNQEISDLRRELNNRRMR